LSSSFSQTWRSQPVYTFKWADETPQVSAHNVVAPEEVAKYQQRAQGMTKIKSSVWRTEANFKRYAAIAKEKKIIPLIDT
jgi:hypothetical protein